MKLAPLLHIIICCQYIASINAVQAQPVTVGPSIIHFNTAPGQAEIKTVFLKNVSSKPQSFKLYVQDWLRDSVGGHQYYKADTLPQSCASIISIEPASYIKVDSGKTGKIIIRIKPPTTASNTAMKWAMLFIESLSNEGEDKEKSKKFKMQINNVARIGVHIYQTPPGAITKAVEGIRLSVDSVQKGFIYLYMKNTGQVMLTCKAHLELTYLPTGEENVLRETEFPVFPDGFRKVKFNLPKDIKPGSYSLLAVLDYGTDVPLEAVQQNITILPAIKK